MVHLKKMFMGRSGEHRDCTLSKSWKAIKSKLLEQKFMKISRILLHGKAASLFHSTSQFRQKFFVAFIWWDVQTVKAGKENARK